MITRKSLADEIDTYDQSIADLNAGKKDCFDAYRDQLIAAGVAKPNIKLEIEAVKAAIRRRRLVAKDANAVQEKDALTDEIFAEITAAARAPRATREKTLNNFGSTSQSYAEAKGVERPAQKIEEGLKEALAVAKGEAEPARWHGFIAGLTESQKAAALAYRGDDTHGGEITDTQEQPEEPAEQFQAKASEDNGAPIDPAMDEGAGMTGEASRVDAGRTASATSERMDATAGETAPIPPSAVTPPSADKTGAAPLPSSAAPVAITDEDVPAFLRGGKAARAA